MNVSQEFLSAFAIAATVADLQAVDCSGLIEGQIAVVVAGVTSPNVDPGGTPFYMYLPTSTVATSGSVVLATSNSNSGVLAGRWVQLTWTFA